MGRGQAWDQGDLAILKGLHQGQQGPQAHRRAAPGVVDLVDQEGCGQNEGRQADESVQGPALGDRWRRCYDSGVSSCGEPVFVTDQEAAHRPGQSSEQGCSLQAPEEQGQGCAP